MAKEICPSFDFWCDRSDEPLLSYSFIVGYAFPDTGINTFNRILLWFGKAFILVFAHIEAQKIKAIVDVRYL